MNQKPGPELLGDRRAADEMAALEDQRLQPVFGEVRRVHQAVVAAADDDRVVRPVAGPAGPGRFVIGSVPSVGRSRRRGLGRGSSTWPSGGPPIGVVERQPG